jgi:signal peptidase I
MDGQDDRPSPAQARGSSGQSAIEAPLTDRNKEDWGEFFRTALYAVLLALVIRTFLYEPFNIPSGSMLPTLEVGDYLFVYKPSYGYSRHSFPFGIAPIDGRMLAKPPLRGDVVVFKLPSNPSVDYIKRVIGLPGDRIQVREGRLYINETLVPREPVGLERLHDGGMEVTVMSYIETLPGGVIHRIYEVSDDRPLDDTEIFIVPEGHYFMMGDNRDNSQDSRVQSLVGYVPYENFVGRADRIFFSFDSTKTHIRRPWTLFSAIRYNRIFRKIEPIRPLEGDSPPVSSPSSPVSAP